MSDKSLQSITLDNNYKHLIFHVSESYKIPEEIQQLNINEFEGYLSLLAGVHKELIYNAGEKTDSIEKEKQQAKTAAAVAKQVLSVRQEAARQYDEWQEERNKLTQQLQRLQLQLEKSQQQLQEDRDRMEEVVAKKYEKIMEDMRRSSEKTVCDAAAKVTATEKSRMEMVEFYKEQLTTATQRTVVLEEKLLEKTAINKTSSRRGRAAEETFAEQAAAVCGWSCERTADVSHSCDYRAVIAGLTVLFELKNYTNIVPAKEIQKFRRDMDEHREVHVGIFITMETEISGMRAVNGGPLFKTEWTSCGQLLIFMTHFNDDVEGSLVMLDKLLVTAAGILLRQAGDSSEEYTALTIRLERGMKYLETAQEHLRSIINRTQIDKRTADDNYAHSLMNLKQLREEILMIFQELAGTAAQQEPQPVQESPSAPPTTTPKKRSTAKKDKN